MLLYGICVTLPMDLSGELNFRVKYVTNICRFLGRSLSLKTVTEKVPGRRLNLHVSHHSLRINVPAVPCMNNIWLILCFEGDKSTHALGNVARQFGPV